MCELNSNGVSHEEQNNARDIGQGKHNEDRREQATQRQLTHGSSQDPLGQSDFGSFHSGLGGFLFVPALSLRSSWTCLSCSPNIFCHDQTLRAIATELAPHLTKPIEKKTMQAPSFISIHDSIPHSRWHNISEPNIAVTKRKGQQYSDKSW